MKYKFKIQYKKYFKFGGSNENPPENEFSNLNINDSTNPVRIFDDNDYQPRQSLCKHFLISSMSNLTIIYL